MFIKKHRDAVVGAALLLALALVPLGKNSLVELVSKMIILAVLALSLNLQLGLTGLMPMGHALMFGLSTYGYGIFLRLVGLGIGPSILMVLLCVFVLSILIGYVMLKSGNMLAYAFLNMGICLLVYTSIFKIKALGNDMGMTKLLRLPFATGTTSNYYFTLAVVAVIVLCIYLFNRSPMASVLRGIRENETKVAALGINVLKMRLVDYVISNMVACVAGLLYAMRNQAAFTNDLSADLSMQVLIMVVLGGSNSFWGPILGAAFVTFLTSRLSLYTVYYNGIFGIIIVLIVLFMRGGILGSGYVEQIAASIKRLLGSRRKEEGAPHE